MKLLAIAHDLPPSLYPQSIQIGRLLSHVPPDWKLYLATTTFKTPNRCDAYEDLRARAAGVIDVPAIDSNRLLGLWRRLVPAFFQLPEPARYDMSKLSQKIRAQWASEKFDGLISFACPFSSHLLCLTLKKIYGCPWTAHFSDPWADNPLWKYGSIAASFNRRWEEKVFQNADRLIFVSEETRNFYSRRYPGKASKMRVLEHSFDASLYPAGSRAAAPDQPLIARFLGNLYGGRNFENLFKAFALLSKDWNPRPPFVLELVLSYSRPISTLIQKHGLQDSIRIIPPVDYRKSLELMKTADLLLTIDTPLPASFTENLFFPSKLADYLGAGKPILALAGPGTSRRIVKNYGGWVADPENPESIAESLRSILMAWQKGTLQTFTPTAETYKRYRIETKAPEFAGMLP